jgi:thymidylate synthase ThyX
MKHPNSVELVGHYGGDETHALSAWTSTSRELTDEKRERIPILLARLARDGHHTPFEKSALHFLVTTDIATHIHLLKHRIGVSCLAGDTVVRFLDPKGAVLPGGRLTLATLRERWQALPESRLDFQSLPLQAVDLKSGQSVGVPLLDVLDRGRQDVRTYTTGSGAFRLRCTPDHRLWTREGWVAAEVAYLSGIPVARLRPTFRTERRILGQRWTLEHVVLRHAGEARLEPVYDLVVGSEDHAFCANRFVVHNCNAESARYKELREDRFYVPEDWPPVMQEALAEYTRLGLGLYHQALEDLVAAGFSRKRAKESARFFRTYGTQITADLQFNWRSFQHFLGLRMKPEAQDEVRLLAERMLRLVREIPGNPFQYTLAAFNHQPDERNTPTLPAGAPDQFGPDRQRP